MIPLLAALKPICTAELFNDLAHLPPSLELTEIDYMRVGAIEVQRMRAVFGREVKQEFLQFLAAHHGSDLTAMGLNAHAIERMQNGEYPENHRGIRLNASIDHIRSLNFGGTNDFGNLALLPARLNSLKDTLENLQLQKGVTAGRLITITPKNNAKVPFVEGGFQRARMFA